MGLVSALSPNEPRTFNAVEDLLLRLGISCALGDSISIPQRVTSPRPEGNAPDHEGGRQRNLTNPVDQVASSWDHRHTKTVEVQEAKTHSLALLVEVE